MNVIGKDFSVLSNYFFFEEAGYERTQYNRNKNPKLLAIEKIGKESSLCEIESKSLTKLNLFLRIFNRGELRNKYFHLKEICKYLSLYHWKALAEAEEGTESYRLFANVSELAYKNYFYKNRSDLLQQVAQPKWFQNSQRPYLENQHLKARYYVKMLKETLSDIPYDSRKFSLRIKERILSDNNPYKLQRFMPCMYSEGSYDSFPQQEENTRRVPGFQRVASLSKDKLLLEYYEPYTPGSSPFGGFTRTPGDPTYQAQTRYRQKFKWLPQSTAVPPVKQSNPLDRVNTLFALNRLLIAFSDLALFFTVLSRR